MKLNRKYWARLTACLFAFAALTVTMACSSSGRDRSVHVDPERTTYRYYYQAENFIGVGDFPSALVSLDSALYYNPGLANIHNVRGWVYEQMDVPDSAKAAYLRCLSYQSSHPMALSRLSQLYLSSEAYETAATFLKRIAGNYPDSTDVHLKLAGIYYELENSLLAMDHLRAYLKATPAPKADYWRWLGKVYYQTKDYKHAITPLQKYTELVKDDPDGHKYLGFALFESGDYDAALSVLNEADRLSRNDPAIYIYRARYFLERDKPDAALQQLTLLEKIEPENQEMLYNLGVLKYKKSAFPESMGYFEKLIRIKPDYWDAYRFMGFLAERDQQYSEAREYYKQYLDNSNEQDSEVLQRFEAISLGEDN